jgi:hypothetical protein
MAQKFIKKWFEPGEIDGEIVKIKEGQSLKAMEGSSEVDLIKIESGKVMLKGAEAALQSDISALESDIESALSDAKSYADGKISDLVNGAPIALDTLKELADKLSEEESALNALITQVDENLQDAKDYSDEKLAAHLNDAEGAHAASAISFDNSGTDIVATNLQTALVEFGTVLTEEIEAEVSRAEGAESGLQSQITQEIADRQSADAAKLLEAKLYSDSLMSAEVDARNAAISVAVIAEREARELFDASFDSRLTQEVSDRQSALDSLAVTIGQEITSTATSLMGTIGAVNNRALAAEGELDGRLDTIEPKVTAIETDMSDVEGYGLDLRDDLDQEISDRAAADTAKLVEAKAYTDSKIAAIPSVDLSGYYSKSQIDSKESALDSKISTEKERVDAILSASQADKDTFAEIVQLINQVDTTSDEVFAGYVLANDAALAEEIENRIFGDNQLQSAIDMADGLIYENKEAITALQLELSGVSGQVLVNSERIDFEVGRAQGQEAAIRSEFVAADSAIREDLTTLEAQVSGLMSVVEPVVKEDEEISPSVLTHVDLENEALKIYKLCVGRVQVFKGVDYSVSVVEGKTRITWIGDMASGGSHAIALSDKVYCTYLF